MAQKRRAACDAREARGAETSRPKKSSSILPAAADLRSKRKRPECLPKRRVRQAQRTALPAGAARDMAAVVVSDFLLGEVGVIGGAWRSDERVFARRCFFVCFSAPAPAPSLGVYGEGCIAGLIQSVGFWDLGFRVQGFEFRVRSSYLTAQSPMVLGSGFRIWVLRHLSHHLFRRVVFHGSLGVPLGCGGWVERRK